MRIACRSTVARQVLARRNMSTAQPKMHKAKGNGDKLASKRPVDHDDLHVSSRVVVDDRAVLLIGDKSEFIGRIPDSLLF